MLSDTGISFPVVITAQFHSTYYSMIAGRVFQLCGVLLVHLVPIRFWWMGHGRIVSTLATAVGGEKMPLRSRVQGSKQRVVTWSNSPMIGIYPAASTRRHVLIFLHIKMICSYMLSYQLKCQLGTGNSIHFGLMNGCSWESVVIEKFLPQRVSIFVCAFHQNNVALGGYFDSISTNM